MGWSWSGWRPTPKGSPFDDREFDVVTSSFGAMFAPNHQVVADELVRVCRPGGRIGMLNFTPEGLAADFFGVLAPYAPAPPPGGLSPLGWGSEEHVRGLFGGRVVSLEIRREYVERADSPSGYVAFVKATFGPVIGIYASLAGEPERAAALDRDFLRSRRARTRGHPKVPPSSTTSTCSWSPTRPARSSGEATT